MADARSPAVLDHRFGELLRARKQDFVQTCDAAHEEDNAAASGRTTATRRRRGREPKWVAIAQHGGAVVDSDQERPAWPDIALPELAGDPETSSRDGVIETFVAGPRGVAPTGEHEPYVSAWLPLVRWVDAAVRNAMARVGVELTHPAYVTASLAHASQIVDTPHLDDDRFAADDGVGIVAILGQHAGPTIARSSLPHRSLRPGESVRFDQEHHAALTSGDIARTQVAADTLVVFPQFAQLHAGPPATALPPGTTSRQLIVFRASTAPGGSAE